MQAAMMRNILVVADQVMPSVTAITQGRLRLKPWWNLITQRAACSYRRERSDRQDADGTPDVFDEDNDGDGVLDFADAFQTIPQNK